MLGIERTHREEQRRKQGFRLFIEERVIDMGFIARYVGGILCDIADFTYNFVNSAIALAVKNKAHSLGLLLAIAAVVAMLW